MDFYFDATAASEMRELRLQLGWFFRRHATADSDFDGADLALSELLTNAVRHAPGPAWVHVDWTQRNPRVEIHDLGPGLQLPVAPSTDPLTPGGHGLRMVAHVASELQAAAKRAGGTKVSAVMPVQRPVELSHDPPRHDQNALPAPQEADDDGMFAREPFLRALIVQLAHAVERQSGPDAAQAAIAQVGADVGGRMEDEYRRARHIVDELQPAQIADLYVRLKAAIGGDFYVIEAS